MEILAYVGLGLAILAFGLVAWDMLFGNHDDGVAP